MLLRIAREVLRIERRNYKNFGHKRQPVSRFTVAWHGFLTFSFMGLCVEWKRVLSFFAEEGDVITSSPASLE